MGFDLREFLNANNSSKKKQAPAPASTAMPKQTNLFAPVANFASRAYDQINTLDSGRSYQTRTPSASQAQRGVIHQTAANTGNIGRSIGSSLIKGANTAAAGIGGYYGVGKIEYNALFNRKNLNNTINGVQQSLDHDLAPGSGLFGSGTYFKDSHDAATASTKELAGKAINNGVQIAAFAAPELKLLRTPEGAIALRTGEQFAKDAALKGSQELINPVVSRLTQNAVQGAAGSALGQQVENGKIDLKQTAKDAVTAAALAEIHPVTTALAGKAVKGATKTASKVSDLALAAENTRRANAGIPLRPKVALTTNELGALGDYSGYLNGEKNGANASELHDLDLEARAAANKLGIDITSGNTLDRANRISQELDKQYAYQKVAGSPEEQAVLEGGYVKKPFVKDPIPKVFTPLKEDPKYPNSYIPAKLPDVINDTKLFEKYPDLKDVTVKYHSPGTEAPGLTGKYDPKTKTISLPYDTPDTTKVGSIIHEIQHAIQDVQGRSEKTAASDFHAYADHPLEVEARAKSEALKGEYQAPASEPPPKTLTIEPSFTPKVKVVENSLTKGGKEGRQNLSPESQAQISGEHVVRNTKALGERGTTAIEKLSTDDAINQAHERMAVPAGKISDEDVAFVSAARDRADAEGRPNEATALHDSLSEHLVANGQTSQAASLLYQRSPQGILYQALRDIKRAGVKETPEMKAQLQGLTDAIKNATNPVEKMHRVAELHQAVSKIMPQNLSDQLTSIWKAGLLSGVKTQAGNFTSNATFAALKGISDLPAAAIDKGFSFLTKTRTKTATQKGFASGFIEGTKKGAHTLKTGFDERNYDGGKYEQHAEINFKNKAVQKVFGDLPNMVFRGMNAADQPWYYGALKKNMYDLAKAEGITKGLKGSELKAYMEKTVTDPKVSMVQTAKDAADKATLNYDTIAAKGVQGIHKGIDAMKGEQFEMGRKVAHGAVNVLAPFVRVPTAYLSRALDYTPVGAIKAIAHEAYDGVKGRPFDQRRLSEALGEATTGTAAIFLGATLASKNLVSGQQPTDAKEAARWKAEHITPNSIKVDNKWVSLNYLGPAGILLGAGKDYHDALAKGDSTGAAAIASAAGAGKNLSGQSFLTGFSGFSNAIQDPQRSAKSFINSEAGSIIPSAVNDAANFGDKYQRDTNTAVDAIKSRIPGLRNTLPTKQDIYGNPLQQRSSTGNDFINRLNVLANPLRPSDTVQGNKVIDEVSRLHTVDPANKDLQVTPTAIDKVLTFDGIKTSLTTEQRKSLQTSIGQNIQKQWGALIDTPLYKGMSDADKATALDNVRKTVTAGEERKYQVSNKLGQYDDAFSGKPNKLSTDAQSYLTGNYDPTKVTPAAKDTKTKADTDYAVASSNRNLSMTRAKTNNDLQAWGKSATEEYDALEKLKKTYDPTTDQVKINSAIKKQEAIKTEAQKYTSQGYIKKPKVTVTKTGKAKGSKYDYAKGLSTTNKTAFSNATALRNLVKKTRITKRRIA